MPKADTTPPTLRWYVRKNGGNTLEYQGNGVVAGKLGDELQVTLRAYDPQGVRRISLGGGGQYTCLSGGIGQNKSYSDQTDVQNLSPSGGGQVLTKIILLRNFKSSVMSCGGGFSFVGGSHTFVGKGENYFGGVAQGSLTFNVTP